MDKQPYLFYNAMSRLKKFLFISKITNNQISFSLNTQLKSVVKLDFIMHFFKNTI